MPSTTDTENQLAQQSSKFTFRPSKLSSVTEKIWKKDGTITQTSSEKVVNLIEKATFTSSKNTDAASTSGSTEAETSKKFIFGQNIKERVIMSELRAKKPQDQLSESTDQSKQNRAESVASGPELPDFKAFTNAGSSDTIGKHKNGETSLEQSAKKYEESKSLSSKIIIENVEVKTGEETDMNILHASCKLHIFDHDKQTWEERGSAVFRLNESFESDRDESGNSVESSIRIIVRLHGSLKVAVNSRIWTGMLIERLSQKRLKLSALDYGNNTECSGVPIVVLYLITASQNDIDKMERVIRSKLSDLKSSLSNIDSSPPSVKRRQDDHESSLSSEKKMKPTAD